MSGGGGGGSCFILSGGDLFKSLLHKISCAVAAARGVEGPVCKCRPALALKRSQMNGGDKRETAVSGAGEVGVF